MTFLDEQLERVYLYENVEKGLSQLKTSGKMIADSMKSGNLFQARRMLNMLPDSTLDELIQVANKDSGFRKYQLEAKRIARGDQTDTQKAFIIIRASLQSMKDKVPSETVVEKIDEALLKFDEFAKKYSTKFSSEGFTLALVMSFLAFLFDYVPILSTLISLGGGAGILLFFFGLILYVTRIILNTYFSIKGIK